MADIESREKAEEMTTQPQVLPKAKLGAQRMASLLTQIYRANGQDYLFRLERIANYYVMSGFYDDTRDNAEIRNRAQSIRKNVLNLTKSLMDLPIPIEAPIKIVLPDAGKPKYDQLGSLRNTLMLIDKAIEHLAIQKNESRGGALAVLNFCLELIKLREEMTGKPFKKYLKPADDIETGNETQHFTGEDPEFVLLLAQAMDPLIRFSTVRTALMKMSSRQEKNT